MPESRSQNRGDDINSDEIVLYHEFTFTTAPGQLPPTAENPHFFEDELARIKALRDKGSFESVIMSIIETYNVTDFE
jgi:hypothetical protein